MLKRFDFAEQNLGNFESFPRGWRPIYGPGYPRFLEARFDLNLGHLAAPSFKFSLGGGSVGASYQVPDIPANPACEYRISGWIRTENLVHGSARLSAYYLDQSLNKIADSEHSSREIRTDGADPNAWRQVTFDLPAGFSKAKWIGLTCRVEAHSDVAGTAETSARPRPIAFHDIHATASFDDICVLRIPRLSLSATSIDGVYGSDEPIGASVRAADLDGRGIHAQLEVLDANDAVLQTHPIKPVRSDEPDAHVEIKDLVPGFYQLRLVVTTGMDVIEERRQNIIRLAPEIRTQTATASSMGIQLGDLEQLPPQVVLRLLNHLDMHQVSLRLWRDQTTAEDILHGRPDCDKLLTMLADSKIAVTAMLSEVPRCLRNEGDKTLNVFDVLADRASRWRAYVNMLAARYAERVSTWQLDEPRPSDVPVVAKIDRSLNAFRTEAKSVIGPSRIAVGWPLTSDLPSATLPADALTLYVPATISANKLSDYLDHFASFKGARRAVLSPPELDSSGRIAYLGEWARRLIVARASNMEVVSVPQPWTVPDASSPIELQERFLIERTIAQTLDGMHARGRLEISDEIEAQLFSDDQGTGALALWRNDEEARDGVTELDVGSDARSIDLWGNAHSIANSAHGRQVTVGPLPTIIYPINAGEFQSLASLNIDSPGVRADIHPQDRSLSFTNHGPSRLIGRLRIFPPNGWRIEPSNYLLDLAPNQSGKWPIRVVTPSNATIGDYRMIAQLQSEADGLRKRWTSAPLYIASPGLDVRLVTHEQSGEFHIIQKITNQTTRPLQLRSSLVCPNLLHQTRFISDLPPGQSTLREYVIRDPKAYHGQLLRATVEEVDGNLRVHQVAQCD